MNWKEIDITPTWDAVAFEMQRAIRWSARKPESEEVDRICQVVGQMGDVLAKLAKLQKQILEQVPDKDQAPAKSWDEVIDRFLRRHGIEDSDEVQP